MYLGGQGNERGYAMAALLVSVAILAILMSVALPAWRHQAQREREIEFIFRAEQWVRGIAQFQRRYGPGVYPQSLEQLVRERFVRKHWKDPLTGEDFVPLRLGQQTAGRGGGPGGGQLQGTGGIVGVTSKSTAPSIIEYKGATRHDQFQFNSPNIGAAGPGGPGAGGPGIGGPGTGGRGGPGTGGRGIPGVGGDTPGGRGGTTGGRGGTPGGRGGFPAPPGGPGRGGRGG